MTVVDDNTLEADDQNATYQWLDCNDNYSAISGETNSIFITQTPGDYAVELTVNGCADTSICYTITDPLGIQGLNDSFEVTLYPNPTFNTITWSFIGIEQLDMELFDLQGKLLMHQNGIWDQDQMSLEELFPGSYLIRVKSKYGNREIRLVKQ